MKLRLKTLQLELTSLCNLRCPLCFSTTKEKSNLPPFFPFADLVSLLSKLPTEVETVNLYGKVGEPLLYSEIVAAVKEARKRFPNARLRISTNGMLLSDYLAEGLAASPLDTLFVALDGATKESYKKYRRRGNFKKVCKNIKAFSRLKKGGNRKLPRLMVQFIPMAHNLTETAQLVTLAHELGANGVRIKICGSVTRNKKFNPGPSVTEVVKEALHELPWSLECKTIRTGFCSFDELYVDCAGNIYPCCHAAAENALLIGNCRLEEKAIWQKRMLQMRRHYEKERPKICQDKCGPVRNKSLFTVSFKKSQ